jgi:hypothetical protein
MHCHRKLARLNEHLRAHRHEQEIKLELNQFNAIKKKALDEIAQRGQAARIKYDETVAQFESLKRQHAGLRGFWNYLKRRSLAPRIEHAETLRSVAAADLKECLEQVKAKEDMSLSEFGDLSLEGRRSINLMLIAVAQELYLHFSEHNVSALTREASVREVADVNYGDINACRTLNIHIEKCMRSLPNGQELVVNAHQRTRFLEKNGDYRLETDTLPPAGSFAEIPVEIGEGGDMQGQKTVSINVLADEYWDVCSVLLN